MNTTKRRKLGIALAITMLVLSVMTLISVAFFQAYHSHFSITRSSRSSETAAAGCEAAFDYVSYRLEHDRDWGSADFVDDDRAKDPASPFIEIESLVGTRNFEGKITATGATVKGTIHNNLAGLIVDDPTLPPETARCEIECKSGDSTRRVEFLVRRAPLFDSSALSRADLNVDAKSLTLRSKDSNRNMLRSEQDIYVPDMLSDTGKTKFYQHGSDTADNNGLLWAKGDIYSYDEFGTAEMVNEADEVSKAQETSNGKIASRSGSHFSVFDMDKDLIKIPGSHASVPVNKGRWTFTKRSSTVSFNANYDITNDNEIQNVGFVKEGIFVDVLEYYANPEDTVPTKVFRAKERTEDLIPLIPEEIVEETDWLEWSADPGYLLESTIATTGVVVDIPEYGGNVEILEHNQLFFDQNGMMSSFDAQAPTSGPTFIFDLRNQEVSATHDAQVEVPGPFHVTSEENGVPVSPPKLLLGYEGADVDGGVSKAVIRAKDTIDIKNGITEGLGALISEEGDVKVQPRNTDTVSVNSGLAGSGLLIFAGRDVELRSPEETAKWTLKGLVYARGGIRMTGEIMVPNPDPTDPIRFVPALSGTPSATFEGSLVALGEAAGSAYNGIEFDSCEDIEFIYDSKLLDAYVAHLPGERIQVETVYWRD